MSLAKALLATILMTRDRRLSGSLAYLPEFKLYIGKCLTKPSLSGNLWLKGALISL
jgi:hypothetical protein